MQNNAFKVSTYVQLLLLLKVFISEIGAAEVPNIIFVIADDLVSVTDIHILGNIVI